MPVNIYELGLIYGVRGRTTQGEVAIRMTLTAPNCPVAGTLPARCGAGRARRAGSDRTSSWN